VTRLLLAAVAALLVSDPGRAGDTKPVYRIGLPGSAVRDVPPALLALAGLPFEELWKDQTGLDGEVVQDPDTANVVRALDSGKLQFGVLQGHEYAWAQEKYPALVPLVCSIDRPKELQAVLLVRHDSKAKTLGDLKGGKVAIGANLRDHARLFLDNRRADEMAGASFAGTEKTETVHDAIHKVIAGDADVAVADHAAWSYFQKLYPGPSKNIKVLARSGDFPATVLVYKKGALDEEVVKKIKQAFLTAHQTTKGARMMTAIRVERFEAIPDGYEDSLKACRKLYPMPADWAAADTRPARPK
jgi:ABC-type phosphate/phosphonate transport system substrate-binding protein